MERTPKYRNMLNLESCQLIGNQIQITVKSDKAYRIRLVNVIAISVSQGDVKIDKKDTIISLSGNADLTVTF